MVINDGEENLGRGPMKHYWLVWVSTPDGKIWTLEVHVSWNQPQGPTKHRKTVCELSYPNNK